MNGDKTAEEFKNALHFDDTVIQYEGNSDWIDETIEKIYELLEGETMPTIPRDCKWCHYVAEIMALYEREKALHESE